MASSYKRSRGCSALLEQKSLSKFQTGTSNGLVNYCCPRWHVDRHDLQFLDAEQFRSVSAIQRAK